MRLKCAACGAAQSLDVLLSHDGAREAVLTALQLPAPLGKLLIKYIALFRPEQRDLSFDRVAALLAELLPDIERGKVERNGRLWVAPLDAWKVALEATVAARDSGKLKTPLKGHGYLYEVLCSMADKREAKAEETRERTRRHSGSGREQGGPRATHEVISAAMQNMKSILATRKGSNNESERSE